MRIVLRRGLLFVSLRPRHRGEDLDLYDVLLDTGSAGTVFATDAVS
jgi:hypothetical protein